VGPSKHVLGGGAHWSHLANISEPSMCGGDAACCQITLTTCLQLFHLYVIFFCRINVFIRTVGTLALFDGPFSAVILPINLRDQPGRELTTADNNNYLP